VVLRDVERDVERDGERDVERDGERDVERDGERDVERDGERDVERDGERDEREMVREMSCTECFQCVQRALLGVYVGLGLFWV